MNATAKCWLWPDRTIGKRESRQLREEHNKIVNQHAELLEAVKKCEDAIGFARLTGKLSNSGLSPVNDALVSARTALDHIRVEN